MSHSQFHSMIYLYLDMHGLIFETSVCYWQDQPDFYSSVNPCGNAVSVANMQQSNTRAAEEKQVKRIARSFSFMLFLVLHRKQSSEKSTPKSGFRML